MEDKGTLENRIGTVEKKIATLEYMHYVGIAVILGVVVGIVLKKNKLI